MKNKFNIFIGFCVVTTLLLLLGGAYSPLQPNSVTTSPQPQLTNTVRGIAGPITNGLATTAFVAATTNSTGGAKFGPTTVTQLTNNGLTAGSVVAVGTGRQLINATVTSPLFVTAGELTIQQAGDGNDGFLLYSDFAAFNDKPTRWDAQWGSPNLTNWAAEASQIASKQLGDSIAWDGSKWTNGPKASGSFSPDATNANNFITANGNPSRWNAQFGTLNGTNWAQINTNTFLNYPLLSGINILTGTNTFSGPVNFNGINAFGGSNYFPAATIDLVEVSTNSYVNAANARSNAAIALNDETNAVVSTTLFQPTNPPAANKIIWASSATSAKWGDPPAGTGGSTNITDNGTNIVVQGKVTHFGSTNSLLTSTLLSRDSNGAEKGVTVGANLTYDGTTLSGSAGSGMTLSTERTVNLSNVTTLVETAIATNSHALNSTNDLALETWLTISGSTNYAYQHWDTYFRAGQFAYSNTLSGYSNNASMTWARWATNHNGGGAVLYVKAGLTNQDSVISVKSTELFSTNGVVMGGGGGGSPAWGGTALASWSETTDTATTVLTVTNAIPQGGTVLLPIITGARWVSSVADSRGNSYSQSCSNGLLSASVIMLWNAVNIATGLQSNDTVTITWDSATYSSRAGAIFYGTGATGISTTNTATGYGTAVSAAKTVSDANTLLFGVIRLDSTAQTYGSGNWTTIGDALDYGSKRSYFVQKVESSTGSKDPGGTLSGNESWAATWTAYK